MPPKKSHPYRIDLANPQKNFVEAAAINHGEDPYEYIYSAPWGYGDPQQPAHYRKTSGFGHGIGQRAGKLRLSGSAKAHRIGKR